MPKIAGKFELTLVVRNLSTGENKLLKSKWPSPTSAASTGAKMMLSDDDIVGFEVKPLAA